MKVSTLGKVWWFKCTVRGSVLKRPSKKTCRHPVPARQHARFSRAKEHETLESRHTKSPRESRADRETAHQVATRVEVAPARNLLASPWRLSLSSALLASVAALLSSSALPRLVAPVLSSEAPLLAPASPLLAPASPLLDSTGTHATLITSVAPLRTSFSTGTYAPPRPPREETMAERWASVKKGRLRWRDDSNKETAFLYIDYSHTIVGRNDTRGNAGQGDGLRAFGTCLCDSTEIMV